MASDVREDLGLESELANGLAVCTRLLGGSRGGELDVLHTESIESLGDSDLSLSVEECVCKLLSLYERTRCDVSVVSRSMLGATVNRMHTSESTLDDVEVANVGQEIGGAGGVWVLTLSFECGAGCIGANSGGRSALAIRAIDAVSDRYFYHL